MYTQNQYLIIFFFYGLAFFTMGIAALLQSTSKDTSFPLLKSIHYLGYFGLVHGITEWIIMARISGMFLQHQSFLLVLGTFTNGLSFAFLWTFGVSLLEKKGRTKRILLGLPWLLFSIWLAAFLVSYAIYDTTYLHWVIVEDIMSRYFIGLPGAFVSAYALKKNADAMRAINLNSVAIKLHGMAFFFALYGLLAGAVVDSRGFFLANYLNKALFLRIFGFPVELGRAASAIGITILFVGVVKIFKWEIDKRIERLTKQQAASQERKKLGQELHDVIIQNLFATGLQVENLMEVETRPKQLENFHYIKANLNEAIMQIREFIGQVSGQSFEIEDLKYNLSKLVKNFKKTCAIPINLSFHVPEITLGSLSQEKITEIYYILQEALCNAIKHSQATHLTIEIKTTVNTIIATVKDNGIGFDQHQVPEGHHYGLITMRERASKINGQFIIKSSSKGTLVSVIIPWEESEDAKEKH
ncbi:Signal transduction histidine kinase [Natronincola peptidivorans]|uniref:histidine kinase n=1 Tax=Natronincola peptidivorans TaxID=426128 RepID=A0A1I0ATT6_9FIRM|nr:sensor histidine kinase [Natronincola peptidivorans]SES97808.1 Signal transduction histidine kinase [Natronincola peptidivorans]